MKKLGRMVVFLAVFAVFMTPVAIAQNTDPAPVDEGVKIFNYYKDCVVDIETTLTTASKAGDSSGGHTVSAPEAYETQLQYRLMKDYMDSGGRLFIDRGNKIYRNRISPYSREFKLADNGTIKFVGTGSFVDGNGYILTAAHVIKVPDDILDTGFGGKVRIAGYDFYVICHGRQKKYKAIYRGVDQTVDAGVLRAVGSTADDCKVANLGNSHEVQVGERVYALGFPYGLPPTLTSGIVSGLDVLIGMNYLESFIQTDAPINPGNSGGPLINARGEVIGINTAGYRGADGLGFAVPLHLIDIERLKTGNIELSWFGLEAMVEYFARTGAPGNPGFQDVKRLNEETGIEDLKSLELLANLTYEKLVIDKNENIWAVVNKIDESVDADGNSSPARRAGFRKGDLITKVSDMDIKGGMDVRLALRSIQPGVQFEVEYMRTDNGVKEIRKAIVTLEKKKVNKDK